MSDKRSPALDRVLQRLVLLRLFLPLVAVTLTAIGAVGYLGVRSIERQQNERVHYIVRIVDRYLDQAARTLDAVARVAEVTPSEDFVVMKGTWEAYGYFDTFYRLDAGGKIEALVPPEPRYLGLDLSNLPYFRPSGDKKNVTISRPFISLRTGNPTVYLVRHLSREGEVVGELSLGSLQDEITRGRDVNRDLIYVLDQTGVLLAHPSADLVKQQTNQSYLEIFRRGLGGDATLLYEYAGSLVLGSATQVERAGWIVVNQVPLFIALTPYAWTLGLALLASLVIWLVLTWNLRGQFQRRVAIPLAQLSRGISALENGDFGRGKALAAVPAAFAEVSTLATNFQQMSDALAVRQAELQESEERYRSLVESLPAITYTAALDEESTTTYVSPQIENLLGFSQADCAADPDIWGKRLHPDDRERVLEEVARCHDTGESFTSEYRMIARDGSLRWFSDSATLVYSKNGDPLCLQGVMLDITERQLAARELEAALTKYRTLFDSFPYGITVSDREGKVIEANQEAVRLLGLPADEHLRRTIDGPEWTIIRPDGAPMPAEEFASVRAFREQRLVENVEMGIVKSPAETAWISVTAAPMPLPDYGVVITYSDIGARKRAEETLRASEERFRLFMDNSPTFAWMKDEWGRHVYHSKTFDERFAIRREDWLGKTDAELWPAAFADRFGRNDLAVLAEGRPMQILEEAPNADGSRSVWLTSKFPLSDAEGNRLVAGIAMDITERSQAEEALVEKSEFVASLLRAVPVAVFYKDREGRYLGCNDAFTEIMGVTAEEIRGKTVHELWPGELSQKYHDMDLDLLRRQEHQEYEFLVKARDGRLHPVIFAKDVFLGKNGEVAGLVGAFLDITERKHAEEALSQANETLRAMLDAAPVGIFDLDLEGRVRSIWNPTAEQMLGWKRDEVLGHFLPSVAEDKVDEFARFREWVRSGKPIVGKDVVRCRKDGSPIEYSIYAAPEYDDDGKVIGNIAVIVDITERKRAEEELAQYREHLEDLVKKRTEELALAKEQAESANQAKSAFLANMSHELRSPLNVILGFTQLMERDPVISKAKRETLSAISRSGEHLLTLINDVLEMSRIEAGHSALRKEGFDLHRTLIGIEEMKRSRAQARGIQFTVQVASDVPRFISTDEAKLRQVLLNLIGNAIKFTTEGGVTLRVSNITGYRKEQEAELSSAHLLFEVEDTGIGIAPQLAGSIFDPFVQAGGQSIRQGAGLGLAISRKYVQLMGGDIHVESELGKGAVFRFEIHADLVHPTDFVEPEQSVNRVIGFTPGTPPYRILVVEDMEESRLLLRKLLESVGFEVREAINGLEAIREYAQWKPHLIWMDMRMPVMDGYEATRRIKESDRDQRTKIICISASSFEEQKELALSSGCDDFVRKPFREADVFNAMSRHLDVQYVYDAETIPSLMKASGTVEQAPVTQGDLAKLPLDLLACLESAAESLKVSDVQAVIEQIRMVDQDLGSRLDSLAREFRYDLILAAIRQASFQCVKGTEEA